MTMKYRLSRKNSEGKWWTYGDFALNKFGNYSASFKVSALQELIELAKAEGKDWVNLSAFEDKPKHEGKVTKDVAGIPEDDEEIPFG